MNNRYIWAVVALLLIFGCLGAAYYWQDLIIDSAATGLNDTSGAASINGDGQAENESLIDILPARNLVGTLDVVGTVQLVEQQHVILKSGGEVADIFVEAGDIVDAGDPLMAINMGELEIEVHQARINLEIARIELETLARESQIDNLTIASANLRQAEEELTTLSAGASQDTLLAAQSEVSSAWARYNELLAGPSGAQITEATANLKKAEVNLQEAQRAYDAIRWLPERGAMPQAQNLQRVTIDYEAAKAAFDEVNKPTNNSELHAALGQAYAAENRLKELQAKPSSSEIAAAEAQIAKTTSELSALSSSSTNADLLLAELKVEQALIELHIAHEMLANAQVLAPSNGTILEIQTELGEMLSAGTVFATIADLSQLSLTVGVSEIDIPNVTIGQPVTVSVDALPNQLLMGMVEQIIPNSSTEQGVVNYPVVIRLFNEQSVPILPGMTAVAALSTLDIEDDSWLIPTSSIEERASNNIVSIVRQDERIDIAIEPKETIGEWTVVRSADLKFGDQVWAVLTSYVDQDAQRFFGG